MISHGPWEVKELALTPEKTDWLWQQFSKHKSLFSDMTVQRAQAVEQLLEDPYSYWMEVDSGDEIIGVIYLTNMDQVVDANIHLLFFDHIVSDKSELVKDVIDYLFKKFEALHRLSASIPATHFAANRLAQKAGMRSEGCRRECLLIGGNWRDERLYGVLAKEVLDGTH